MEKIKFITDSASDIPDEDLARLNIEMLYIPIAVDGVGFYERESFNFDEFYAIINRSEEIPSTSLIPEITYQESYKKAYVMGFTQIINITINRSASGIYDSALRARESFFAEHPEAKDKIEIHVIDSRTYAMAYGYPIIKAAEMAEKSDNIYEILAFLDDWFRRVEIYAACYTLKYAQKSGRIRFATAFVGEILGMRPIISLIDGETHTKSKVRGDKNIPLALIKQYESAGVSKEEPVLIIYGEDPEPAKELQRMFKKDLKMTVPIYQAGAAIVTNIGPKVLAIVYKGELRK